MSVRTIWDQTLKWAPMWHIFIFSSNFKNSPQLSGNISYVLRCFCAFILIKSLITDLYPLPDGVIRGRPPVLLVVEAGAFGRPVGVVLGGGADLVWRNFPWLHTQWLHASKIWQRQKKTLINKSLKVTSELKVVSKISANEEAMMRLLLWI